MSEKINRFFAPLIFSSKRVGGLHEFQCFFFPADESGEIQADRKIESTELLLASTEDLERMHDLLCQVLNKPRSMSNL